MMESKAVNRFVDISMKIGGQVHLATLKDSFMVVMPLFLLAGLAVLVNNVIFPLFLSGDTLALVQRWGNSINNGTLNISALLIAPLVGYTLAKNKHFDNPLVVAVVALGSFVMLSPMTASIVTTSGEVVMSTSAISFASLGASSLIGGIIIGLISAELLMAISKLNLKINLGEDVPSGVARSFEALIPILLTMTILSGFSLILHQIFGHDLMAIIILLIQRPLSAVNNSLIGFLALFTLGNLLFSMGIHHTVIRAPFVDPITLQNMNENMLAFAQGEQIPHIITSVFIDIYGVMGGAGSTIALVLAMLVLTKHQQSKQLARLSIAPALFNINEPIIFGFPIIFNLPMMIPFILVPIVNIVIGYTATAIGLVNRTVALVPWTTPPVINGFLATGGDWRASVLQLLLIILNMLIFLPFMKISEAIERRRLEAEVASATK